MTEYELDMFCASNPDCGCKCLKCPVMIEYQRSQLGFDEDDENDDEW